jgi:hypothetical protein
MSPQPDDLRSVVDHRRYQSQLLNFLNRQGQNWRDRAATWGRQVKLAALWGAQAALYPFYAVFQATRLATRQLQSPFKAIFQLLQPATEVPSDLAIVRVLYSLNPDMPYSPALRVGAIAPKLGSTIIEQTTAVATIEGIASDLATRMIQLIAQGQPIVVLDEPAQGQMQRRITWEMAIYWERWRRFQGAVTSPQLPLVGALTIADQPQLLPPVRLFWQLMAWVQQGPLANQVNWFEETAIVAHPQTDWFEPMGLKSASSSDLAPLIKAAITHFFGRRPFILADGFKAVADPWIQPVENSPIAVAAIALLDDALADDVMAKPLAIPAALALNALPESNSNRPRASLTRPNHPQTARAAVITGSGDLTWANVFASDLTTTLIDTVATPIGYIQHPLERVLQWLDQAILWLETQGVNFAVNLWNWLTAWAKR